MWIGGVSMVTTVLLSAINEFSRTEDQVTVVAAVMGSHGGQFF